jgi:predicted alpha/beta superfamily hydrolase
VKPFLRLFPFPLFLATMAVLLVNSGSLAQQPHTLTGEIRVHKNFYSKILNNSRDVLVYLPPGYTAKKKQRYDVFYMQDGQNLFDGATSFIPGQEWHADETAQQLINENKIEPLIIVGIYNTGKDRANEYTPAEDQKYKVGGKADLYGRMLVEELKPFIDHNYRTLHDPDHTGLGGSSLGGIVSLYVGLKYPKTFGRLAVISPSVWFADYQIVKFVDALPVKPKDRIWLDIGTKEGRDANEAAETVASAKRLNEALIKKGWKPAKDLSYFEAKGAEHNERAWAARLPQVLLYLYGRKS